MLTEPQVETATTEILQDLSLDWVDVDSLPILLQESIQEYADASELIRDVLVVVGRLLARHGVILGSLGHAGVTPWPETSLADVLARLNSNLSASGASQGGFGLDRSSEAWLAFPSDLRDWRLRDPKPGRA